MFEKLKPQPVDKILGLMAKYKADPRDDLKVDLGVGVYKDATGRTPIMRAVKEAEKRLLESQDSKSYVGLLGNLDFVNGMRDLVLSDSVPADRVTGTQSVGGTGAIRQLFDLIVLADPNAKIWISNPSWPNHEAILKKIGANYGAYRYFDDKT
ncbi:MAG TPA: aminotransferase class I/II-fold pyridoxal phosphate-dependent enzyme, partial [Paracoccaceae bacterium]|nr:aminotransferase class I/II-fold pyridoxal phosphate-dependent enzyme [Paracoccaceae bacterium]